MAKATAETGRVISTQGIFADVPVGGMFTHSGRQYRRLDGGSRKSGFPAMCLSDQALNQSFFEIAPVQVENFVPAA